VWVTNDYLFNGVSLLIGLHIAHCPTETAGVILFFAQISILHGKKRVIDGYNDWVAGGRVLL